MKILCFSKYIQILWNYYSNFFVLSLVIIDNIKVDPIEVRHANETNWSFRSQLVDVATLSQVLINIYKVWGWRTWVNLLLARIALTNCSSIAFDYDITISKDILNQLTAQLLKY